MKNYSDDTTCIQGGYQPKNMEPRQLPIYQTTTWKYDSCENMAKIFDLEEDGYVYSRLKNPTNDFVAKKITELEGGTSGALTSSGMSATFLAIFNIANCGDHVVSSLAIYGGTFNLFAHTMKMMGIDFTFVSPSATDEELNAAFQPNTKAVFGEVVSNPSLEILDIKRFAKAAHNHGVPLIIDNTFTTPILCKPFKWGADIVTHSTTKYMDGHGSAVGGAIVDSGNFDWNKNAEKFPGLTSPDESYHGVVYTEAFGVEQAYIAKLVTQLIRDIGAVQAPQNAFLLNLGLESLSLRVDKHSENAEKVAKFLESHPKVSWVRHPSLPHDSQHQLAKKYLPNGCCGVVSFGIKGQRADAEKFMTNLQLAQIETHIADSCTCVLHPASTTHRQMNDEQLASAGITPDLIRLSCGLEAAEEIIADIDQALKNI